MLPAVIALFDQPNTPLVGTSNQPDNSAGPANQMDYWRIAMVRMGRPIEDVPFPPTLTVAQLARDRSAIMGGAERARDHPGWDIE